MMRRYIIARDGKCKLCAKKEKLVVHHNTYRPRGTEHPGDLVALCWGCHSGFHDRSQLSKPLTRKQQRKMRQHDIQRRRQRKIDAQNTGDSAAVRDALVLDAEFKVITSSFLSDSTPVRSYAPRGPRNQTLRRWRAKALEGRRKRA